jgi:hypothetical protein
MNMNATRNIHSNYDDINFDENSPVLVDEINTRLGGGFMYSRCCASTQNRFLGPLPPTAATKQFVPSTSSFPVLSSPLSTATPVIGGSSACQVVDIESALQNRFFALHRDEKYVYVPSSDSNMFLSTTPYDTACASSCTAPTRNGGFNTNTRLDLKRGYN